jgi:hypothetical protein
VPSRVVDIAGVPVALQATDDERGRGLRASLESFGPTTLAPMATIAVDATPATTPARPPHSELLGLAFWTAPDGLVVAAPPGLVITVAGDLAHAHLPDLAALPSFERCVYLPLTWLLARHDRFILHGAAIVRDGRALLLLGASGAGKSTLAVSALEAGWLALADDVVIVHAGGDGPGRSGPCIHGIHRVPAVPTEIGGPHADAAPRLDDPRRRAALPRTLLTGGGHRLAGVVLITHADADAGSLARTTGHQALPLLLQAFAATVDPQLRAAFFETARTLDRLPMWELGHAADPTIRRARAAHHLERCAAELG